MRLRRSFITVFSLLAITVLTPSKGLADGSPLNLAVGYAAANCTITGANATIPPVYNKATTTQYTTTTGCDLSTSLPDGQFLQSIGTSLTTLGLSPAADVMAHASGTGFDPKVTPNWPNADAAVTVESAATFSVSVSLIGPPTPSPAVDGIPVLMTWRGEKYVTGSGYAEIFAAIDGSGQVYTPGVLSYTLSPGEQVGVEVAAICYVEGYQNVTSECQAIADPTFAFDQAKFDAEMGSNTFPLADYFAFAYSPNLSATPEPGSIVLLGTGLLGAAGVIRRRIGM